MLTLELRETYTVPDETDGQGKRRLTKHRWHASVGEVVACDGQRLAIDVLDEAARRIDEASAVNGRFEDKPMVEASIRLTLGQTYLRLGDYPAAEPHLNRACGEPRPALGDEQCRFLRGRERAALPEPGPERRNGLRKPEQVPWRERDYALFVGYAPVDNPRYACAVIVEHGGGGSKVAAPIARDIMVETLKRDPAGQAPGADVVGVNCSVGPAMMLDAVERTCRRPPATDRQEGTFFSRNPPYPLMVTWKKTGCPLPASSSIFPSAGAGFFVQKTKQATSSGRSDTV